MAVVGGDVADLNEDGEDEGDEEEGRGEKGEDEAGSCCGFDCGF